MKAERETANCARQLEMIEGYVHEYGVTHIRESQVLELHKLAVDGIYECGGQYRTVTRSVTLEGGGATHVPPEPALVRGFVRHALEYVNDHNFQAVERMAYALWRFNWIHPFAGGNGRTSRALAYFVWCIDLKRMPPGRPTFPTRISEARDAYVTALRAADSAEVTGSINLLPMRELVYHAVVGQLSAAIDELKGTPTG